MLKFLTAYQQNPCSWPKILSALQDDLSDLSPEIQSLYNTSTHKQLKQRLSTKLKKLMATKTEKIEDVDIR